MKIDDRLGDISVTFTPKGMETPIPFENADQLAAWAQKQKQFFNQFPRTLLDQPASITGLISERFQALGNLAIGAKNQHPAHRQNNRRGVEEIITLIEKGALPTMESARGKEIASLYGTNPLAGAALLALTWDENSGLSQATWPTIVAGKAAFEALSGNNYTAAKNAQESVFEELRKALSQQSESLFKSFHAHIEQSTKTYEEKKAKLEELINEFTKHRAKLEEDENARITIFEKEKTSRAEEWKALKAAYATDMQLRASVIYWNDKRKNHKQRADDAIRLFYKIACCVALAPLIIAWFLFDGVKVAEPLIQLRAALIVGIPTFLGIWGLRLISRRVIINQALEDDAGERIAMVHAFKALEKEGKADPSERLLILQSLFRPATAPTDDTTPTSIADQILRQNADTVKEK